MSNAMDRRNFLKRVATVVAATGVIAVSTTAGISTIEDVSGTNRGIVIHKFGSINYKYKPNYVYHWEDYQGFFRPVDKRGDAVFLRRETYKPEYKVGTFYDTPNGERTYRYTYGQVDMCMRR